MSNTTVTDPFLTTASLIQKYALIYGYSIVFIFGNIGSVLNILILTQRNYRENSCSLYVLASTIINLIIINFIVPFRIIMGFNIDPTTTSSFFCKFRAYMIQVLSVLSRIYIVLACIDRWAMTSRTVQRRAFTRISVPKILIPTVAIVWCLLFLHLPLYQDTIKGRCIAISDSYLKFYSISNAILSGLLIPIFMLIFSLLTIRNLQQLQQRIHNNNAVNQQNVGHRRNIDYQLSFMILVQQAVYIITNIPFDSYLLYVVFTQNMVKSSTQMAIDNLFMIFSYLLLYINFGGTFYLYTLSSQTFRKDLKRLLFQNRFTNTVFGTQQGTQTAAQTVAPRITQCNESNRRKIHQ